MNWYYRTVNPEVGEALAEVKKTNVARLPMPSHRLLAQAGRARRDHVATLVETEYQTTPAGDVGGQRGYTSANATDAEIDLLVYGLYELTASGKSRSSKDRKRPGAGVPIALLN